MALRDRIYTYPELRDRFGISYSRDHIRRLVRAGLFPAPAMKLSPRLNAWRERDLREWLATKDSKKTAA